MPGFFVHRYQVGVADQEMQPPIEAASEEAAVVRVHGSPVRQVRGLRGPICYEVRHVDAPRVARWFQPAPDKQDDDTKSG